MAKSGEQFYTDASRSTSASFTDQAIISKVIHAETRRGRMEDAIRDSRRYRDCAAECLLNAQEACQPYNRKLKLSMAASWLSLAGQDEAIDNLLADVDRANPSKLTCSHNREIARWHKGAVKKVLLVVGPKQCVLPEKVY